MNSVPPMLSVGVIEVNATAFEFGVRLNLKGNIKLLEWIICHFEIE